jgi:hypothetical protein
MNGDSRETGKKTPDGKPDPSVFTTESNREGIRVGTAITLMVRTKAPARPASVHFRQFWGSEKRKELLSEVDSLKSYQIANPEIINRLSLRPTDVSIAYKSWPRISDLSAIPPFNGPVERRGFALISIERGPLVERISKYFDKSVNDDRIRAIHPSLMMTGNRIVGPDARKKILEDFIFDPSKIVPYPFKPFDFRWCYLENLRPLFSEPSPQLLQQRLEGNAFFITRDSADKKLEGVPFYMSSLVCDYDSISGHARHFPVIYNPNLFEDSRGKNETQIEMFSRPLNQIRANLSDQVRSYLGEIGLGRVDDSTENASLIWFHALAIGFSANYLTENSDGIRQDFPRIPLPADPADLIASAQLGRRIMELLDITTPVIEVTSGTVKPILRSLGAAAHAEGKQFDEDDFRLTAGWGSRQNDGTTMPGKGKSEMRNYSAKEFELIDEAILNALGEQTYDIYLNDVAYWRNVPKHVWEFHIGGYQVVKKWLSYREYALLGRPLTIEEVGEATNIIRRVAAILLMGQELNVNYEKIKASTFPMDCSSAGLAQT